MRRDDDKPTKAEDEAEDKARAIRVFLSYSRKDTAIAEALREKLIAHGFDAYLDTHDIVKGEPWRDRLKSLIERADALVFLISPDSVASEICDWEVNEAELLGKRVLPAVCRPTPMETIPPRLTRLNFSFLDDPARATAEFDTLQAALREDADWVREHSRIGEAARRWDRARRPARLLLRGADIAAAESWRAARTPTAPSLSRLHDAYLLESRRASGRRQRWWIAGASTVAAVTAALAVAALLQREAALANEKLALAAQERAEQNFETAKGALNSLIYDLARDLKTVEGVSPAAIRRILGESRKAVRALLDRDPDNPELKSSYAAMQTQFGDVFARTGDYPAAQEAYGEARAGYEALAKADPAVLKHRRNVSVAMVKQGRASAAAAQFGRARAYYAEATALRREILASDPARDDLRRDLTAALVDGGDVALRDGDLAEAITAFKEGVALFRALARDAPKDPRRRRDLATSLTKLAEAQDRLEDRGSALAALEEALAIEEALAAETPEERLYQRDLAVTNATLGALRLKNNDFDAASAALRRSLTIRRALLTGEPDSALYRRDVGLALIRLGDLEMERRAPAAAIPLFEEAVAIDKALAADRPGIGEFRRAVAATLGRLGGAQFAAGRRAAAEQTYQETVSIRRALDAAADGADDAARQSLFVALINLANVQQAAAKLRTLDEALGLADALAEAGRLAPSQRGWRDLAVRRRTEAAYPDYRAARQQALSAFQAQRWEEAATAQAEAVRLLTGKEGASPRALGSAYGSLSWYALFAGDAAGALAAAETGLRHSPRKLYMAGNKAIALMYLGRADAAKRIFLSHRKRRLHNGSRPWAAVIAEDFRLLRAAGRPHPQMDDILMKLGEAPQDAP